MIESFGKIKRTALVSSQVPNFVAEDHPVFVKFLEAYYEFLSQKSWVPSEKFVDYIDVDAAPQEFIDKFWEEIQAIPSNIVADKRLLTKHIRDLYKSKGTAKSIELLFRILYNEEITLYEPKQDMLKPSDGKWVTVDIIRTQVPLSFDLNSLNGRKLYQYSASGIELCNFIVAAVTVVSATTDYLYVEITPSSLNGRVFASFPLKNFDKTITLDIVPSFGIDSYFNRGSLYSAGEIFYSGPVPVYIQDIGSGPVDGIFIVDGGSGYSVGDYLQVDEEGTGGLGLSVIVDSVTALGGVRSVRIVSGGLGYESMPKVLGNGSGTFVPWSNTSGRILTLNVKDAVSENTPINFKTRAILTRNSGSFVNGEILEYIGDVATDENGFSLLSEDSSNWVTETQPAQPITIGSVGQSDVGLSSLYILDSYGSGVLLAEENSSLLMEDGSILSNEFISFDLDRYQVRGKTSGVISEILYVNPVILSTKLDPVFRQSSKFKNEDGFIGTPSKKIQDSFYYQDFSYVIKSSYSFENYKNILYKLIHPAGMQPFGQVEINSFVGSLLNRLKYAFQELRVSIQSYGNSEFFIPDSSTNFSFTRDSHAVSGPSWAWLEKYKSVLGNEYSSDTYGSSDIAGTAQTVLVANTDPKFESFFFGNSPSSFLSSYSLEDILEYSEDFLGAKPLVLDGSFHLDGKEELDGVRNDIATTVQVGKFKLRKDRRIVWQLDSEILKTPLNPTADIAYAIDSLVYTLQSNQSEVVNSVDVTSWQVAFTRLLQETIGVSEIGPDLLRTNFASLSEVVSMLDASSIQFSGNSPVSTASASESITSVRMDSPREMAGATDTVGFFVSSSSSINSQSINSSSL